MNAHPCVPLLIAASDKMHRLERLNADLPDLILRHPECLPIEGAEALAPGSLRLPAAGSLALQSPDGALTVVDFGGDLAAAVAKLDAWRDREPRPTALVLICDRAADLPSGPIPAAVAATITVMTLDVFATPADETLVCPHVLARLQTSPVLDTAQDRDARFFAAMGHLHSALPGRLHTFLDRLALCGIRPVYDDRALTLAWETDGQTVRLAHISPLGLVWTDVGAAKLPLPDAEAFAHRYVERLALELGLAVNCVAFGKIWTLRDGRDHVPNIKTLADKLDVWAEALEQLIACLRLRMAGA